MADKKKLVKKKSAAPAAQSTAAKGDGEEVIGSGDFSGYCVKCKEKNVTVTGDVIKTKNGRYMGKGKHSCGTTVCSIMGEAKALSFAN